MSTKSPKIIVSGVKPTGTVHIGNYFGAMKQMVDLQNAYPDAKKYIMIADYHALNFIQDGAAMRQLTLDLALDYLAIGLDPAKSVIFKQSDISAHTELTWIFDTIVTMPYLMRAHAFKDAEAKDKEIVVGTFNYPVLMTADILLYGADGVPVGADQKQHIEYARDIALKFNHIFKSETFSLPEPLIMESVATVPGLDGRKMSKSYANTIPLFATREQIVKAVMSIVTDSNGPEAGGIPANVYAIHKLFKSETELAPLYGANKGKYKALKDALIEDIDAFIKPLREKREALAKDPAAVLAMLDSGASEARKVAAARLEAAKRAVGVK